MYVMVLQILVFDNFNSLHFPRKIGVFLIVKKNRENFSGGRPEPDTIQIVSERRQGLVILHEITSEFRTSNA